jgi:hypothetical protein
VWWTHTGQSRPFGALKSVTDATGSLTIRDSAGLALIQRVGAAGVSEAVRADATLYRPSRSLRPVGGREFAHNVSEVKLGRRLGDVEGRRDHLVRSTIS